MGEKKNFRGFFSGLLNRLPGSLRRGKPPAGSPVVGLVLSLTRRCNLKCKTCLKGESGAEDLDIGLLDKFLAEFRQLGFSSVALTGGEPVLHPRFREILKILAVRGYKVGMVTNGQRYKDYLEAIAPYGGNVIYLSVSLDSHIKALNDAVRGEGSYDKALAAARAFKQAGYTLRISHVVNRETLGHLNDFVAFVREKIGPDRINIGSVISSGGNSALVLSCEEKARLRGILLALSRRYPEIHITSSAGYYENLFYCGHFSEFGGLVMNPSGKMTFCCDSSGEGFVLGDMNTDTAATAAKRFFEVQAAVRSELVRLRLGPESACAKDCDLCARILAGLRKK